MKKIVLIVGACVSFAVAGAQTLVYSWGKSMGGENAESGKAIATDASGNVYSAGSFQGSADFDPGTGSFSLTSNGVVDIFISKLDAAGNFAWAKSIGSSSYDDVTGMALDAAGNVYLTGYFTGTMDADPNAGTANLVSVGTEDVFVLKLDPAGNLLWAKNFGGTNYDRGNSIFVDAGGNVYTTGYFLGVADFDPNAGTFNMTPSGPGSEVFVSKLDASGNLVWAKHVGGSLSSYGQVVTADASGNVYFSGYFYGTPDFDPGAGTFTLTNTGFESTFIVKVDASGSFLWAKKIGGTGSAISRGIALDAAGNVHTSGQFYGQIDLDPGTPTVSITGSGGNQYISKLDASGNYVWGKTVAANAGGMALDAAGNVYAAGSFINAVDFDPGVGTYSLNSANNGYFDAYVLKLDASGNFVLARGTGGTFTDNGNAIAVDAVGAVYVAGFYEFTTDLDPGAGTATFTSAGDRDVFLLKWNSCLQPSVPSISASSLNICYSDVITVSASSGSAGINWYAQASGGTAIATSSALTVPAAGSGLFNYYAEAEGCAPSDSRTQLTVTINICAGLAPNAQQHNPVLSAYPTPFSTTLFIKLEAASENVTIEVYNLLGALVQRQPAKTGLTSLDLGAEPNGVYFVKVLEDGRLIATQKTVRQ